MKFFKTCSSIAILIAIGFSSSAKEISVVKHTLSSTSFVSNGVEKHFFSSQHATPFSEKKHRAKLSIQWHSVFNP